MASLPRLAVNDPVERIHAALDEHGAVIVEGLLDQPLLAQLNGDVDPLLARADPHMHHLNPVLDAFFGTCVRHVTGLAGKSPAFAENVMCHPLLLGLCDRVLLPGCASYQLNLGHLMDRGPGAEAQWPHRDEDVWVHCPRPHPELQLATVVALVDFHRGNGSTYVVPGSHRWPRDRVATEAETAHAEMRAGSAVIYLGSTIHGGGANSTADEWRRGFHLSYALGWLRTEENNILAVPPSVARSLSPLARRLVGYGVHDAIADMGGYLGMLDMRDPAQMLEDGSL